MNNKICRFLQKSFLIVIAAIVFTGCNGSFLSYKGATITHQNHMIKLQEGDQQGIWKTNELSLKYHYQITPETLKISGDVNLAGGFLHGFSTIDRLVVQLLFLNNQGTVIDNVILYSAENHRPIDLTPMSFDKTIPISQETQAISFTYDGVLFDGGGSDDSTSVNIWNFPL